MSGDATPVIACQRCGAQTSVGRLDLEGWLVRHAFDDGATLYVCPSCLRGDERKIVAEVRREI